MIFKIEYDQSFLLTDSNDFKYLFVDCDHNNDNNEFIGFTMMFHLISSLIRNYSQIVLLRDYFRIEP